MKRILNKTTLITAAVMLIIGLVAGSLIFNRKEKPAEETEHQHKIAEETTWTCSMHPQIRQPEPGLCPICGMELIPLESNGKTAGTDILEMSETAVKLANIQTTAVEYAVPEKKILMSGKVKADERKVFSQTAHFPGRVEELFVDFTGEYVKEGQKLAAIYSPQLITAQEELIEAKKFVKSNPALVKAARKKLQLWKLTDEQIEEIEQSESPQTRINIKADKNGYVIEKLINFGDHVHEGKVIYKIADLSTVWVIFDAYEYDLPWLNKGDRVNFTVPSVPGKSFEAKITFIDPVIDAETRVAAVRTEVQNRNGALKPGMFVNGEAVAHLNVQGKKLIVPKSAVLWTGKRSVVYIELPGTETPNYQMREVVLGEPLGAHYIVEDGLEKGEMVVTNGTFAIDAESQLRGKQSMMNREPAVKKSGDHSDHATMNMENMETATFKVFGNCEMCKERIETAVKELPGIAKANWSVESKMIEVHYQPEKVQPGEMHEKIASVGHDTEKEKAPDEVHESLPSCCQYTREE